MPTRPLIGVLCRTNSVFAEDRTVVDRYVAAVDQTGLGDIVLLPTDCTRGSLECLLAPLDGLVLTGSPNSIDAYRHDAEASAGPFDAARDAAALELVRAAAKIDKPILGICRGLEQINVALGGSLKERFSDAGRAVVRHAPTSTIGLDMFNWNHGVTFEEGGLLRRAVKSRTALVNSVHFRGIDQLADKLRVEARAFSNGQIEAVSARHGPILAVQWNPDNDDPVSRAVFDVFGEMLAARKRGVMMSACRKQPLNVVGIGC
jgi:putative glutamine amidotransferase